MATRNHLNLSAKGITLLDFFRPKQNSNLNCVCTVFQFKILIYDGDTIVMSGN